MLGLTIKSYFDYLQKLLNPFKIYFDTMYNLEVESLGQALSNYNMRQLYKFDILKAIKVTDELADKLRAPRQDGNSYNVLQYNYGVLTHYENLVNNSMYYLVYDSEQETLAIAGDRKYNEFPKPTKEQLKALFADDKVVKLDIHEVVAGSVNPQLPLQDKILPNQIRRLGFWGTLPVTCRFITASTSLYEDFLILYNTMLYRRNPSAFLVSKTFGNDVYPIHTKYTDVSAAGVIERTKGNLMFIEFGISLSTFFLTSFVQYGSVVNRAIVGMEVQSPKKRFDISL